MTMADDSNASHDGTPACADNAMLNLPFPSGVLTVAPGLTPSTVFDTATGKWNTKQSVAVGAVNLTTISLISAAVVALPASVGVRTVEISYRTSSCCRGGSACFPFLCCPCNKQSTDDVCHTRWLAADPLPEWDSSLQTSTVLPC